MQAIESLRTAMVAAGLTPPDDLVADGALHRCGSGDRRNDDAGWYVAHLDGIPAGAFGCWRQGFTQTWCAKSDATMTAAEREGHRQRMQTMQAQRNAEKARRQLCASQVAADQWRESVPAQEHPYLARKGVQPHGTRIAADGFLVVPMRDTSGTLWNLERIGPDGKDKRGLSGGRRTGCYFAIGMPNDTLVVCEGFATGASIFEATGLAVAVAFNAGNLLPVAQALRAQHPALKIVVAADDDWQTDGNPGHTKATDAARAIGGWLAVPVFPQGRPPQATDFNDLHGLCGAQAVSAAIRAAKPLLPDAGDAGPVPTPLPDGLPAVMPFDLELLPVALRGWVADIAQRMQCPPDFAAVGAITGISSLIGARAVVAPKARDDWRVVPNLWGLIVGRPGVMKSPALAETLKPLHRLEAAEREKWQHAHADWELDCKVQAFAVESNEKQAKGLAAKDPAKARALLQPVETAPEPVARRYVVNDATVEKLADLLAQNTWGTLGYRDELHGLLTGMDKPGQEGSRAFYLQAYDGNQGYTVDRISRGTQHIPRVCLAMLGGMQPGKAHSYVRAAVTGGSGDDGLLQRFGLAVWPDVEREFVYVDRWPDTPAKQAAWAVFERLNDLQPDSDDEPQEWRFTAAAQKVFEEWLTPFETEIRGDELHPALVSHLAKYRKLVPALALIFALVDTPDNAGRVDAPELLRALAWSDYLRSHAERLYSAAVVPETAGAQSLLNKIKAGKLVDPNGVLCDAFTPRLVAVKGWTGLATPDSVRKAADMLAEYGWLEREVVPSGDALGRGRPSERYLLHPTLRAGGLA